MLHKFSRSIPKLKRAVFPLLLIFYILAGIASPAAAQENIASYPLLPSAHSSIRVFDNQRRFVGRILPDQRYWVGIDRIPVFLQKAVVAVEDARFYEHGGIDVRGIARALVKDVATGSLAEGGSTITQQLIKNKFLSGEKSIDRKLKEAKLAIEFEKKYTKRQILEMYFNEIYYGNGAWGIAQAARLYFDKNPEELTDGECAILAGIPKNPARYNPLAKGEHVTARRDIVLKRMVELKIIDGRRRKQLRDNPPKVVPKGEAPYYLAHVRSRLEERYGPGVIERGGLDVIAALDLDLQMLAEKSLSDGVRRISPELQGAMICMEAESGRILAAVGGVDYAKNPYDRAFVARRQPGSAIKPLIYAAAIDIGFTPSAFFDDTPVSYDRGDNRRWKPLNYGGESYGRLTLRQALAYSNNVIAVKLLDAIGVPYFTDYAARMGIGLKQESGLSLALGTGEVTLADMMLAYAPLADGGVRPETRFIVRIFDRKSRGVTENPPASSRVISPDTAYLVTGMLGDVMTYGTAKTLGSFRRVRPSAGKTGTTDDYRDAWFIGYTPRIITGVWVGYDKPRPGGKGFTGGAVAAPIWETFMEQALAGKEIARFQRPQGVVSAVIDPESGLLARSGCPQTLEENYVEGSEPKEYCPLHDGEPLPTPQDAIPPDDEGVIEPGTESGGDPGVTPESPEGSAGDETADEPGQTREEGP